MAKQVKTKYQPHHWRIEPASREFGCDGETLSKALKRASIEPAFKDGAFSTSQIVAALFGDYDAQRTRKITAEADLLEMEKRQTVRDWIPAELVESMWGKIITELRQKITFLEVPDEKKKEILEDLQSIPVDDYFSSAKSNDLGDSQEGAAAA